MAKKKESKDNSRIITRLVGKMLSLRQQMLDIKKAQRNTIDKIQIISDRYYDESIKEAKDAKKSTSDDKILVAAQELEDAAKNLKKAASNLRSALQNESGRPPIVSHWRSLR